MEHALNNPVVSVIIPSYMGEKLLQKHLPDVITCLQNTDEIIIVDDASTDASVKWLISEYSLKKVGKTEYKGFWTRKHKQGILRVLVNANTVRFAATCNRGATAARGAFLFLLNSDVSPLPTCRNVLVEACSQKDVFAVGCLEYADAIGGTESGKNNLWFEKGLFFHSKYEPMETGSTAWVSGGSGLFNRDIWMQLGGFDTAFAPAYWEDIDLSHRARKAGYKVLFNRHAVVLHQHETTNKRAFSTLELLQMSWNSADLFTRKHASALQLVLYLIWRPFWWWQRRKLSLSL